MREWALKSGDPLSLTMVSDARLSPTDYVDDHIWELTLSGGDPPETRSDDASPEPMPLPIDGVLDLHTFNPREVGPLVLDYLAECRARGILEVRIIHGKGTGSLRRTVHAVLDKAPELVLRYALASGEAGGWGATLVTLRSTSR